MTNLFLSRSLRAFVRPSVTTQRAFDVDVVFYLPENMDDRLVQERLHFAVGTGETIEGFDDKNLLVNVGGG